VSDSGSCRVRIRVKKSGLCFEDPGRGRTIRQDLCKPSQQFTFAECCGEELRRVRSIVLRIAQAHLNSHPGPRNFVAKGTRKSEVLRGVARSTREVRVLLPADHLRKTRKLPLREGARHSHQRNCCIVALNFRTFARHVGQPQTFRNSRQAHWRAMSCHTTNGSALRNFETGSNARGKC
jgi:hypothetical protein